MKGRESSLSRSRYWDKVRITAKLLNGLGVVNQEGIQDHRQQEALKPSRWSSEPKLEDIPLKL